MTEKERDEILAELLRDPAGRQSLIEQLNLDETERVDIESMADIADMLWEAAHGAPPLTDDPVAAMLGLVPDPQFVLDPRELARARKNAGLKPSDLAARLATRGWNVQGRDVFRWETQSAADVAPALIRAIAEEIGTAPEKLAKTLEKTGLPAAVDEVRRSPKFRALVDRWANLQAISPTLAATALESRMLATVHRGERPDAEQLLGSLSALVDALETESRDER
ncbi:hypothetical protein E9529_20225 [Blastococcus sp. KM273128]|uniref:hypothetical protein n=1 Tax=Blastococcus sp. KM273128 TaxID=2570314 RepID=UPI001F2C55FE|nr:hypothetical protein [Blastococcus sp. KM273128]MCF6746559.1 hypothetical protein [Blastococcus sp. KM273128]